MSTTAYQYNISVPSFAGIFKYTPYRDGDPSEGWNSSYSRTSVTDIFTWNNTGPWSGMGKGAAYQKTTQQNATVQLSFEGTAIYLCLKTHGGKGILTIDNNVYNTLGTVSDPACSPYDGRPDTLLYASGLSNGTHQVVLQTDTGDGTLEFDFFGVTVTLDAGTPAPKVLRTIDDSDSSWSYSPPGNSWSIFNDMENMWRGSYHLNCVYGSSSEAFVSFTGASAVILHGLSSRNNIAYTVTLDGNIAGAYNASDYWYWHSPTILFMAGGLNTSQEHQLTVTHYVSGYTPTIDHCLTIDALVLVTDDPNYTQTESLTQPSNSSSGSSAGQFSGQPTSSAFTGGDIAAVTLGVVSLALLATIAWLLFRQKQSNKRRYTQDSDFIPKGIDPVVPVPWRDTAGAESSETSSRTRPVRNRSSYKRSTQELSPPQMQQASPWWHHLRMLGRLRRAH